MPTAVRLAQASDAEGISQVILAALHSSNAGDYPADVIARVASNFTPPAVLHLLARRTVLVAIRDQLIVATAAWTSMSCVRCSSTRRCKGRASAAN